MKMPKIGNVVIIGYAAAGKTHFTKELASKYPEAKCYHTDSYISNGFKESLYVLMSDLKKDRTPLKIIEGILGYRLLRKGVELGTFSADLIIIITAPKDVRYFRIAQRRSKNVHATFNLDKICDKIYQDYLDLVGKNLPAIKYYDNEQM